MTGLRVRGAVVLAVAAWTSLVCPPLSRGAAFADKLNIAGFVGNSSTSPAARVNVVLYSKDKDQVVDSVQTNFLGRYKFSDVQPGTYVIRVGKVEQEVVVVKKSMRIDIDLTQLPRSCDRLSSF